MAAEKKALESINHQAMKYIRQALSEICFGELILVAQDSRLIQIERSEKIRIQQNAPSCQRKAFEEKELSFLEEKIRASFKNLDYGQLVIVIKDGKVKQMDRTIRSRFTGMDGEGI